MNSNTEESGEELPRILLRGPQKSLLSKGYFKHSHIYRKKYVLIEDELSKDYYSAIIFKNNRNAQNLEDLPYIIKHIK